MKITMKNILNFIIRLMSALAVLIAIMFAIHWGGIFTGSLDYFKLLVSWAAVWIAIDFYAYCKYKYKG